MGIYTKSDNTELSNTIAKVLSKRELLEDSTVDSFFKSDTEGHVDKLNSTETVYVESKPTPDVDNTTLFKEIETIATSNVMSKKQNLIFFSSIKGNATFNIDKSVFIPNKVVMLSNKTFYSKYMLQLESMIFNNKDNLGVENLFSFIYLMDYIVKDRYPVLITTGKFKRLLPTIVKVLNDFFNKHYSAVNGIYTMFKGVSEIPKGGNNART